MKFTELILLIQLMNVGIYCFPQSASEIAAAVRLQEQNYNGLDAPHQIPFDNPIDSDNAILEHEGYGSKIDTIYEVPQKKASEVFNSQPVVDNIEESEKFGNNGENLQGWKRLVVGAMSAVSKIINKVLETPQNAVQTIVTSGTAALNSIGAKIVGLQK
ncbi:CLUMA_CG004460, isoform A [Clunio marinus]|uniref:CLUMA_CG004460, isoform A n=1 Tax=Clunio marinus TaxID=568069 RepID=A0A1J1HRR2_9DIPT|nr:CLUMA_CG004460, isoform A [Clunio marinus]